MTAALVAARLAGPGQAPRSAMRWLWPGAGAEAITAAGLSPLALSGARPLAAGRFGDVLRVEEGTANLVANPSFEVDTTGWSAVSTATLTRVTAQSRFGAASGEVVTGNAGAVEGVQYAFAGSPSTAYTATAWVRGATGGSVRLSLWDDSGGADHGAPVTLTGAWQQIAHSYTSAAGAAAYAVWVATNVQQSVTFQVDGVQVEAKGYATSYCDGSLGTGYAWTGSAHASTSTRTASRVQIASGVLSATQGAVALWLRPQWSSSSTVHRTLLEWGPAANSYMQCRYRGSVQSWRLEITVPAGTDVVELAASHAVGADLLLVYNWSASLLGVSCNGGALTTAARAQAVPDFSAAATADLGSSFVSGGMLNDWASAALGPAYLFNRLLTQAEIDVLARMTRPPRWGEVA